MALSSELLSEFAKITNDKKNTKKETTVYGTIAEYDGGTYVKLDGSELLTPITTTTDVAVGDRVTVLLKNHTATITGNITSPAVRTETVRVVVDKVTGMETVMADVVTTADLNATNIRVQKLEAGNVEIVGRLEANEAAIKDLAVGDLSAVYATIENLEAANARIDDLETNKLSAKDIEGKYANIDLSNIGEAAMEHFYSKSGLIEDVTIGDATITGRLVGVTISGDLIETDTLVADKLVIQGEDGLYYKLNTDGIKTEAEQTEYNSLNGGVLIKKSITASKISVDDLVAFDATIGGFNITDDTIYSGVKSSVDNTTRGVYLDNDGQVAFGDASNYLKYYKDTDGSYKLVISASDITFGVSGTNLETALNDVQNDIDGIAIGGRNLIVGSAENFVANSFLSPGHTIAGSADYTFLDETYNGCVISRWSGSATTGYTGPAFRVKGSFGITLTVGETYTFSAWMKADIATALYASYMAEGQTVSSHDNTIGTTWSRVYVTFVAATESCNICMYSHPKATAEAPYIYMCGMKLEKGNKPTDWTPAPEDVNLAISDTNDRVTGVQSNLDNLSIGGRNLIIGSADNFSISGFGQASGTVSGGSDYQILDDKYMQCKIARWSGSATTRYSGPYFNVTGRLGVTLDIGETYALSAWVKADAETSLIVNGFAEGQTRLSYRNNVSTNWSRVYVVFTATASTFNVCFYGDAKATAEAPYIYMCGMKLEKGNKPTDWSPAPEDVDDGITRASQTATDYMNLSSAGLVVGQNPSSPTAGNTLIGTDGVTIRKGTTNLAAFKAASRSASGITSATITSSDSTDSESDGVTSVKGTVSSNETRANVYISTNGNPVYFPNGLETDKVLINNDSGIISNANILLNGSLVDKSGEGILTPLNSYGNMIIGYGRFQDGGGTHIYGNKVKAKSVAGFSASVDGVAAIDTNNSSGNATFGWHLYEANTGETNIYGNITSLFAREDIRLNADGNNIRFNGDIVPYEGDAFNIGAASLPIHNLYISFDNTGSYHGLRFADGSANVVNAVGINGNGWPVFGNTTYCTNIITKSTTTENTGYSFKITCGDNPALVIGDSDARLFLFGGTDSTSRYIGSIAAYKRTYSSSANLCVTENGIIGRATSSSERYKKDIVDLDLEVVKGLYDLPVRQFKYRDEYLPNDDPRYGVDIPGFIAEEVEMHLPIACDHIINPDGQSLPEMWNSKIIVPALLKLIQDLNDRLKIFETKGA